MDANWVTSVHVSRKIDGKIGGEIGGANVDVSSSRPHLNQQASPAPGTWKCNSLARRSVVWG